MQKICARKDCGRKGELQPLSNFYKKADSPDGYAYECSECCMRRNQAIIKRKKKDRDFYSQFSAI